MRSDVVWNQTGAEASAAIRAAVPDVEVVDIDLAPEVAPTPPAGVLFAVPRHTLPRDQLASVRADWASGVEWVHTVSAGIDTFPPALLSGRRVTCARGVMSVPIAEFVLAAILAAEKHLPAVWQGAADSWDPGLGSLEGRTLGLIGIGSIGEAVARRALPFGMHVLAARRTERPSTVDGVVVAPLAEVAAAADHLVLAAPATADTRALVGPTLLAGVKPGVHLVNVARGSMVDQASLLAALDDGRVGLATLDVTDPEPLPAEHVLRRHPRVRLSAHVAWSGPQVRRRSAERFIENLVRYRAGDPLLGAVDLTAGY